MSEAATALLALFTEKPKVSPTNDGVLFSWTNGKRDMEIRVDRHGNVRCEILEHWNIEDVDKILEFERLLGA